MILQSAFTITIYSSKMSSKHIKLIFNVNNLLQSCALLLYKNKHSATNKLMKFLETYTNQLTLHETFSSQNNVTMNKVFIRSQFLVTALILVNLTFVITKSAQEWPSKATERLKVRLLMIMWLGFFLTLMQNIYCQT